MEPWVAWATLAGGVIGVVNVLITIFLAGRKTALEESYERRIRQLLEHD